MYQIPVNDVTTLRKARTKVKVALEDIGLEYCKEVIKDFKDFSPGEDVFNDTLHTDVCVWDPAYSKIQEYRSRPFCCGVCRFSSRSYPSYQNHFRHAHKRTIQNRILLKCSHCTFVANKATLAIHVRIFHKDKLEQQAARSAAIRQRQMQPKKPPNSAARPMYYCKKCMYRDTLYNGVRRHIYREHFKHVATPYLGMVSKSSVQNGAPFNGDNILCKRCRFTTKSYESLVQHVIEYHERIGAQVTTMIGHSNVAVSNLPSMSQKSSMIVNGGSSLVVNTKSQVIGYLKPASPVFKAQSLVPAKKVIDTSPRSTADESGPVVNTGQTQKWKICTVCNELFPENLYSAHFESAHKARIVWALAKYIMKIHNFTSKCLLCNRYLPSDTLLNHMLIHGITCPQCHTAFHSVEKLLDHERQVHLEAYVGPPGASPLTFDLTIKQNIQLHILTFNMNKADSQDQSSASLNMGGPVVKAAPSTFSDIKTQAMDNVFCTVMDANESERPMCPLCCAILKDPLPNALAIHLRQRHQVLQTMHPVEKRLTYKCIHCLGVYTSNMVASTITLHLVQCRGVGRNQGMQGPKAALPLHSSGVSIIKNQLPTHAITHPRKAKMSKAGQGGLALDPKINENKTYEARKNFLRAYFNQKPYLSLKEEKKLSASLWVWKADICKHFETMQNVCKRECETSGASVLLGFDMQALKKVKHNMIFENIQRDGTSEVRSGGLKSGTPNMTQNVTQNCTKLLPQSISSTRQNICTEPILIDSDSEPETEPMPVANRNGHSDRPKIESRQSAESTKTMPVDNPNDQSDLQETESQQPESTETEPITIENTEDDSDPEKTESQQPSESTEIAPVLVDDTNGDPDLQRTPSQHPAETTEIEPVLVDDTKGDPELQKIESQQPSETTDMEPMLVDDTDGDADLQKIEFQQPSETTDMEPMLDDTDGDPDLQKTESQQPSETTDMEPMIVDINGDPDLQKTDSQQPAETTEMESMLVDDTNSEPDLQKTESQQPADSSEKTANVNTVDSSSANDESLQDGPEDA